MYWNAHDYYENSQAQIKWAIDFIKRMDLNGVQSLLDVGCGDGKITYYLKQEYPHISIAGVDKSPEMIALAKDLHPQIDFRVDDAQSLHFPNPVNAIVSFSCFHWISQPLQALQAFSNKLLQNGKLYILCAPQVPNNMKSILDHVRSSEQWSPYFKHFHDPMHVVNLEEAKSMLSQAGLHSKRMELVRIPVEFATKEQFKHWIKAWASPIRVLDSSLHDPFMEDVFKRYLHIHPQQQQDPILYHDLILEIEAEKA